MNKISVDMKQNIRSLFLTMLMSLISSITFAHDLKVGGIYYNIISRTDKTVEVTYDGNYSSKYSGNLTIPNKVTYGGTSYSVTSIGEYAFERCSGLKSVTISSGVTTIGRGAFEECSSLISIEIPNSVTSIGSYAFCRCSSLTSVTIGSGVTSIDSSAFQECSGLTKISVDVNNPKYDSRNECNAIIETATNTLLFGFKNTSIPNSVTSIDNSAFQYCSGLTSIVIPSSVTSIGSYAFEGCTGLTSIVIPSSVESIGKGAFSGCSGLTKISVDVNNPKYDSRNNCDAIIETATNILLFGCNNTSIPNGVTSIGYYAFWGCSGLTSIEIPGSVTSIGEGAFWDCTGLTSIEIPNSVTSINSGAFGVCSSLISIEIPNSVTSIGENAFWDCPNLSNVVVNSNAIISKNYTSSNIGTIFGDQVKKYTILNSVTSIGKSAFSGCTGLTSIEIPNSVTSIGEYAFSDCSGLTSINIPNSVTSIGGRAFEGCSGLTSINIPNSVTSIGGYAFRSCKNLTQIIIPNSVTSIGENAFSGCPSIQTVFCFAKQVPTSKTNSFDYSTITNATLYVPMESLEQYKSTYPWSEFVKILGFVEESGPLSYKYKEDGTAEVTEITDGYSGTAAIPQAVLKDGKIYNVETIGDNAFSGCTGLTSIEIPNSVTSIGESAFSGCSGLTSINLPDGLTSIGEWAFYNCSGLTSITIPSITIPNSVTSIGASAFSGCSNIGAVLCNAMQVPTSGTNIFDNSPISNATLYVPTESLEQYKSTSPWSGFGKILGIGEESGPLSYSYENDGTAEVSGIKNGYSRDIVIPQFVEKDGKLHSVTSIGNSAFYGCTGITSIEIPNSVTSIGNSAFYGCTGITSIEIPNSVTSIDSEAFENCTGLTSIVIPSGVTSIGFALFRFCKGLTSIEISNSVTSIDSDAFRGCSGLNSIIIPNSVTSIGNDYIGDTFYECTNLRTVFCLASRVPTSNNNIFSAVPTSSSTLYVPVSSLARYKSANPWRNFGTILGIGEENGSLSYSYKEDGTAEVTGIKNGYSRDVVIPKFAEKDGKLHSVTKISSRAFYNCSRLTSIEIPNSVTSIGDNAFSGCLRLTSVEIPNSVTSIGESAFARCSSIQTVICHAMRVPTIETNIFDNSPINSATLYVPLVLLEQYKSASPWNGFGKIIGFESGDSEIRYNYRDDGTAEVTGITEGYSGAVAIQQAVFKDEKIYDVTSIGEKAFVNCSGLTSIEIPNSVTSIGGYAFEGCTGLTSIEIPNSVTSIGGYAFEGCTGLTSIEIPNSVTSIGGYAFSGCTGLTSIEIPNSVTSIASQAFAYCTGLTSINLPDGLTSIGNSAFSGCSSLASIIIPNSVSSIGESAFSDCSGLTSINIPNSVTSIGGSAFYGCSGLTSVEIPNSVTSIGDYAFAGCSNIDAVLCNAMQVPTTLGYYTFDNTAISNDTLYVPMESLEQYKSTYPWSNFGKILGFVEESGPLSYKYKKDGTAEVTGITEGYSGVAAIPQAVLKDRKIYNLTAIANSAFSGCSGLTSIEIPNSVTSIGEWAFYNCSGLTSINLPDGLTSIGEWAFYNCSGLTSITIPR